MRILCYCLIPFDLQLRNRFFFLLSQTFIKVNILLPKHLPVQSHGSFHEPRPTLYNYHTTSNARYQFHCDNQMCPIQT